MTRFRTVAVMIALLAGLGCHREERGPILTGGRELKSWLADLRDARPAVRRVAVIKLGNVGEEDPSVAEALAGALHDRDALVRREAVRAVAKLPTPGESILGELRALSKSDPDKLVRDYAGRALAHAGAEP